jgi:hypothetical protein
VVRRTVAASGAAIGRAPLPNFFAGRGLAIGLVLLTGAGASSAPYRDAPRHFTFNLPDNWEAMSAQEIGQINPFARAPAGMSPAARPDGLFCAPPVWRPSPRGTTATTTFEGKR